MTIAHEGAHATAMAENAVESLCRDCGRPASAHDGSSHAARCVECFDGFLRERDIEFLSSYAELGVMSRRIVAESSRSRESTTRVSRSPHCGQRIRSPLRATVSA